MNLHDYAFTPYTTGDRIPVADESHWREPLEWEEWYKDDYSRYCDRNSEGLEMQRPRRPRAMLGVDLWPPLDGPVVASNGRLLATHDNGKWVTFPDADVDAPYHRTTTSADLIARTLRLTDATPHVDWLVPTRWPERVLENWPYRRTRIKPVAKLRPNLHILAHIQTQADVDRMAPALLKLRDLTPTLGVIGELEGPVDLSRHLGFWRKLPCGRHVSSGFYLECVSCSRQPAERVNFLDWVIIRGVSKPMHPDWIRSIRDQCVAAGVAFWFDGWGDYGISGQQPNGGAGVSVTESFWVDTKGNRSNGIKPGYDWVNAIRVGRENSGRLLDGREWTQTPWDKERA